MTASMTVALSRWRGSRCGRRAILIQSASTTQAEHSTSITSHATRNAPAAIIVSALAVRTPAPPARTSAESRIDGLLPQARNLRLRIAAAGYREQVLEVDMDNSRWLGEIRLAPA